MAMPLTELIVDNFAGGGGATTGIEMAVGRSVDIAINHAPDVPLYTMELSVEGKVMQVRGLRNSDPCAEVKAFVGQYKEYIKNIFRKKARKTA